MLNQHSIECEAEAILLVEDDESNAFYASRLIEVYGCEVTMAGNGKDALAKLDRGHHRAVFLDVHLPVMNGVEFLKSLREEEARLGLPAIPVHVFSADVLAENRDACMAAGADGFIEKPYRPRQIKALLDDLGILDGEFPG